MSQFSWWPPPMEGLISEEKQFSGIYVLDVWCDFICESDLICFKLRVCLFFVILPHFFLLISAFCLFVCFLFGVLCWLAGPRVACLLSCPSLNIARQSTEPWASSSTKVKFNPLTHNHASSPLHSQMTNTHWLQTSTWTRRAECYTFRTSPSISLRPVWLVKC